MQPTWTGPPKILFFTALSIEGQNDFEGQFFQLYASFVYKGFHAKSNLQSIHKFIELSFTTPVIFAANSTAIWYVEEEIVSQTTISTSLLFFFRGFHE